MKRISALVICFVLMFTMSACGVGKNSKIQIVTTIFPVYDWVREIVGDNDNIEITMLIDSGADLHSFQPTTDDIINMTTCDMFVYVGGESDKWAEDALKEKQNKDMVIINLLDALEDGKKEEEIKEGMEAEETEEEEIEYDEHIWLSLKNAKILCGAISDGLSKADKENADNYKKNAESYLQKLDKLDGEYEQVVSAAKNKTLVFGDRFPFRYMTDDYGIDYYAAFVGCSADSEASFKTIIFLAEKLDALNLGYIIKIEGSKSDIANSVIENSKSKNAEILTLDSMQSVTAEKVKDGATYIGICEKNLEVLKKALN
ncbi:MAG: zinc ABC transporter substrate-binding protein [Clostridia bacterium]|nr:zinc ABC transporter substrate-binding protein [Clostridia bacterium]